MIIGKHKLKNNIILAPMAGVTDRPFRMLCKKFGAIAHLFDKKKTWQLQKL